LIAFVEGPVAAVRESSVLVAVGGVGLEVFAPRTSLERCTPGQVVRLETYLLVREDALALYGFVDTESLELFRLLLGVSGVGPRLALALLSTLSGTALAAAVLEGDAAMLASTPGVGRKTAERLVLELQTKLPAHLKAGAKAAGGRTSDTSAYRDAVEALVALGYREAQVRGVVSGLLDADPGASAETLIRKGLSKVR
jgi:Holliday junction DNA helicase RuvA